MALVTAKAAEELKALQKANDDRLVKQGNGDAAVAFAKDVKSSLLFQYDWGELLSAAPMCLSLMGSCYAASCSPKASGLPLDDVKPAGGFKCIQNPTLRACLVQISSAGHFSFISAAKNMDSISSKSDALGIYLQRIGMYLAQLPNKSAEMMLQDNLQNLKEGADDCLSYAQKIEKDFLTWLELVCEVHQVTVAKEEKTEVTQKSTEIEISGVSIAAELTESSVKDAEDAAKNMKQNMDESRELFKKAADAIPSPLAAVGIQLVASIGQSVTTAIAVGLPAIMNKFAGVPAPAQTTNGTNSNSGGGRRGGRAKTMGQANTDIADVNDPAYRVADQASVMATVLATLVGVDTTNGVDWEHLYPETPAGGGQAKGGLTLVDTTLRYIQDNTSWSQGSASTMLKKAIVQLLEVTKAIKLEAAKDGSMNAKKADASSAVVLDWQKKVTDAKTSILSVVATSKSMPGGAPGSAPYIGVKPSTSDQPDALGANSALASAQEKARLTEAAYTSAQANYTKAVEVRSKAQADLARIKSSLASLNLQKASLEQIKQVLRQCIGALIQMKSQITNLVMFFSALSAMVEHVMKESVKDFMRQVGTASKCVIGGISLLDQMRSDLYTTTLMMQAYFSLFKSIANMYKEIHVMYIADGLHICEEMGKTTDNQSEFEQRLKQLNEYTSKAQEGVKDRVTKFQNETTSNLKKRVELAAEQTKLLPLPTPLIEAANDAINQGTGKVTEAVADGLDANMNGATAGMSQNALD